MRYPAGECSVRHLFDAAMHTGWTLVGYRLPGESAVCWFLPENPLPVLWNQQSARGFVLAPFTFPATPAHWIARDVCFTGFHLWEETLIELPHQLRAAVEAISVSGDDAPTGINHQPNSDEPDTKTSGGGEGQPNPNEPNPQVPGGGEGQPNSGDSNAAVLNAVDRPEFESQVSAALGEIASGRVEKVVLARSEAHPWPTGMHPVDFVERLCTDYPQAFVNLVLHPKWGVWIGATPELLLELEPAGVADPGATESQPMKRLRSMALAGTLPVQDKAGEWGEKEIREQQVVDDFIARSWATRVRNFRRSARKSLTAGPVQHLCTLLEGESDSSLGELVRQLHPTPAVGGWPKAAALDVIHEIEKGARQLYGGFLGPVESPAEARLFVNLRTLQLRGSQAHLHIGCGILGGSEPSREWAETVHKAKTLLRHLNVENPKGNSPVKLS